MKTLTENDLIQAAERLVRRPAIRSNGSIPDYAALVAAWRDDRPVPSEAEIVVAVSEIDAENAVAAAVFNLAENLKAAYAEFSNGGKLAFGAAYDLVMSHIGRGDVAVAKAVVERIEIPAEVPGVPAEELATCSAKKTEILALFP